MIALVKSEWIKAYTVRSQMVIVAIAFAFPLILTSLICALADADGLDGPFLSDSLNGAGVLSALLLGVVGALSFGQESTYGTLRVTFALSPVRWRAILAKIVMVAVMAAVVAVLIRAVGGVVGSAILSSRDVDADFALAPTLAFVVLAVLLAWFGLSIAMLTGSTPISIVLLIAWPLIIENLLAGLLSLAFDDPFRYLPLIGGINALGTEHVEGFGRVGSLAYLGAWVLALLAAGSLLNQRRDA